MLWLRRLILFAIPCVLVYVGAVWAIDRTLPLANTATTQFDTLIVLGYPAQEDGTPRPEMRERVMEAVREYRSGVAPRMIMTGGAAHNQFVEAHVMAQFAEEQGVPASAIIEEGQAKDTIQNAFYSVEIMQKNGWHSAEVVSSHSHLPRASLIFSRFPIEWRMHAAPWPSEYDFLDRAAHEWYEAMDTARLRLSSFPEARFLPAR
ncbi:MAG TPA: YdcF family protein [Acidobacteriaceae bacterium]